MDLHAGTHACTRTPRTHARAWANIDVFIRSVNDTSLWKQDMQCHIIGYDWSGFAHLQADEEEDEFDCVLSHQQPRVYSRL